MTSGLQNIETVESPFRKFVTTIGVFPTAFTDAMTYYECLAYLVKYIENTLIPAINDNAEATKELQKLFIELKSFVDNYFANLDVTTEIDNKLDQMAEDGTLQEIIGNYLDASVQWTFDTVTDMQSATNLVEGSYARTLGFHSINDGGGALYYVTNSGTANEMDVIQVGSVYANLVYGKEINVLKLGAKGDDTTDDYDVFEQAATLANTLTLALIIPKAVYKIESELDLRGLVIRGEGTIDNTDALIIGGSSTGSTKTSINLYQCNDILVEGAKNSYIDIEHVQNITLYADGSDASIASIAYNKFEGIECASITINGVNNGWINENEFNYKRCHGNITITGDGSYIHNNNHFNDICIEGSDKKIKIDYGFCNYITYRGEASPVVELNSTPENCYGNVIERQYYTTPYNAIDFTENTTPNFINLESYPTLKSHRIFELNSTSVKNLNAPLYANSDGEIFGNNWTHFFDSGEIDATYPFIIKAVCDTTSIRPQIVCYDANGVAVQGNLAGPSIVYSNGEYITNSNVNAVIFGFYPNSTVKKIRVRFRTGSNFSFHRIAIDLYQPFTNSLTMQNTISTIRKYYNSIPSGITNASWATGDIVWNSAPTTAIAGWICTNGTNNTWAIISSTS